MQHRITRFKIRTTRSLFAALLCAGFVNIGHAITPEQATEHVRNLPCKNNLTADEMLNRSIKSHAQTDIGWHTFQEDGYYDVERTVLANKGMELRFRWKVQSDGSISPENDRTTALCSAS